MVTPPLIADALGLLLAAGGTAYALAAVAALAVGSRRRPAAATVRPVSVLKPLCGTEPRLYENLRSFCTQSHPRFQVVCGVRDPRDPACAVVERLQREFPDLDLVLVRDPRVHGANLKVSNLINLLPAAEHDWLVIADSDIAASPDYLRRVTAPLADPRVGVVTCLYRGRPLGGIWARLGAMFIDEWFAPSVRVAAMLGSQAFGFGATLALRRATLAAIGGFEVLRDRLADDWWLAAETRRLDLRTVLSDVVVDTDVTEASFTELWAHELRWLRTIRSVAPLGYAFSFFSIPLPVVALGAALADRPAAWGLLLVTVAARLVLHYRPRTAAQARSWSAVFWVPARDLLTLAAWCAGLFGRQVRWRRQRFEIPAARAPAPSVPIPEQRSDKR